MFRNIIASLLLFILFLSQIGYEFVYKTRQHFIKEDMLEQILKTVSDNKLCIIDYKANQQEIIWEKKGKEFSFENKMYDVVKIKQHDGNTFIYCLNDEKEQQLLDEYYKAVKSTTNEASNKSNNSHLIKFQLSDFVIYNNSFSLTGAGKFQPKYFDYCDEEKVAYAEIITPPPKFYSKHLKKTIYEKDLHLS